MKWAPLGLGAILTGLLVNCASPPSESERLDDSIVLTKVAPKTDFSGFKTYYLRPEIRTLDDSGELAPVDNAKAQPVLSAIDSNMSSRGFTKVEIQDADLGVEVVYVEHVNTTYWCYNYWDSYYWGYPYWGYYPYWGSCDATVWKSGMLSTVITDLTGAKENPGGPEEGGAGAGNGGAGGRPPAIVAGIWFSGVYSVTPSTPDAVDGINQSFKQSPYIKAGQ
jgi:hypothetical protein